MSIQLINGIARMLAGLDCSFMARRPYELWEAFVQRVENIAALPLTERAAPS